MKRNVIVGVVIATIVAVMLYAAMKAPRAGVVAGGQSTAPDFGLKDLNGSTVRLSDYRGKAVVLNFWATWCPPCKEEIPWFVDLQNKYGSQGLQIIGVSMDEGGRGTVAPFIEKMGVNYQVVLGTSEVGDLYGGVHGLPTTFYIGRDGKILEYVPGLISHRDVEQNIKAALATSVAPVQQAKRHD